MNPLLLTDFYKVGHVFQYPEKTTLVYSNLTPRKSRIGGVDEMVFFGLHYFIEKYLVKYFQDHFFDRNKQDVLDEYKRIVKNCLGDHLPSYSHIEKLHDLGYLPIEIKALPEGSSVGMKVPV
jgi:nicotinamide phosphoribosyltransferase